MLLHRFLLLVFLRLALLYLLIDVGNRRGLVALAILVNKRIFPRKRALHLELLRTILILRLLNLDDWRRPQRRLRFLRDLPRPNLSFLVLHASVIPFLGLRLGFLIDVVRFVFLRFLVLIDLRLHLGALFSVALLESLQILESIVSLLLTFGGAGIKHLFIGSTSLLLCLSTGGVRLFWIVSSGRLGDTRLLEIGARLVDRVLPLLVMLDSIHNLHPTRQISQLSLDIISFTKFRPS